MWSLLELIAHYMFVPLLILTCLARMKRNLSVMFVEHNYLCIDCESYCCAIE